MNLQGRVALVTGSSSGIGAAVAERLTAEGCTVFGADLATGTDVTDPAAVAAILREIDAAHGQLDILVNNAGGAGALAYPRADERVWHRVLDVNLRGVMLCTQLALPLLRASGDAAVVNIASLAGVGHEPHPDPEYAAAKAGVIRFTTAVADWADDGVRVNCICPDWVDTPASRRTRAAMTPDELATVPPVVLRPEQIADVVVMLIGDDRLAGRVVECWCGQDPRLLPASPRAT